MNHKTLVIRLDGPGDLYVMSAEYSLARLRIVQDRIVVINVVLRRKIAGVGCCPMLIQHLAYFLISHTTLLISPALRRARRAFHQHSAVAIAIAIAPRYQPAFWQRRNSLQL